MKRQSGFTIIELLVVIAIITMLIAFTSVGVTSMGSASRLNQGGNLAVDMVQQARLTARAANSIALLVIAKEDTGMMRLMSIYEWSASQAKWQQVTRWEILPGEIEIDEEKSNLDAQSLVYGLPEIKFRGVALTAADFKFQAFLPDGRVLADNNPVLHLSAPLRPENYYRIVINTSTGLPIIERP